MKPREISVEEFALDAGKFFGKAQRQPLIIRSQKGKRLVLKPLSDDDLVDELIVSAPSFKTSIRRARQNRAASRGVDIHKVHDLI